MLKYHPVTEENKKNWRSTGRNLEQNRTQLWLNINWSFKSFVFVSGLSPVVMVTPPVTLGQRGLRLNEWRRHQNFSLNGSKTFMSRIRSRIKLFYPQVICLLSQLSFPVLFCRLSPRVTFHFLCLSVPPVFYKLMLINFTCFLRVSVVLQWFVR